MLTQTEIDTEVEIFKEIHLAKECSRVKDGQIMEPYVTIHSYDHCSHVFDTVNIPVSPGMFDAESKAILFREIIPLLFKLHAKNFKQIICFSFSSECWMWTKANVPTEHLVDEEDIRKTGVKSEVLMVSFECEQYSQIIYFNMIRTPGEITLANKEVIDSRSAKEFSGNVPGLFKKYNLTKQN